VSAPVTTPAPATGDPSRDLSRLARGGALNLAGSVAYGLLNFVLVIIVTRGLGKDASGVFFEAVALFVIASNTAELGADTGLVRFIARYRTLDRVHDIRWTLVVALVPVAIAGTALALVGLYYAEPLSSLFGSGKDADALVPYVHLLILFLPLSAINTVAIAGTRGFGTMNYELKGYEAADLVRMDILVNNNRVDALSVICDRADAQRRGKAVVKKLKDEIDRHMFEVAIQAAIGSRVISRETKPALRKNVTAKCYGGDISRKRKLWEKQKEGKKRMKSIGQVDIPQKAFLAVLETGEEEGKKK